MGYATPVVTNSDNGDNGIRLTIFRQHSHLIPVHNAIDETPELKFTVHGNNRVCLLTSKKFILGKLLGFTVKSYVLYKVLWYFLINILLWDNGKNLVILACKNNGQL